MHYTFQNGVTVSIQIGGGDYCDNQDLPLELGTKGDHLPPSTCCEVATWPNEGEWVNLEAPDEDFDSVIAGYVPVDEVIDALILVRSIPSPATTESIESALLEWRVKQAARAA